MDLKWYIHKQYIIIDDNICNIKTNLNKIIEQN